MSARTRAELAVLTAATLIAWWTGQLFIAGIAVGLFSAGLYRGLFGRAPAQSAVARESQFESLVERSNEALIGTTIDGVITSWNKAAERILGHTAVEAIGRSMRELIVSNDLVDEDAQLFARVHRGEHVVRFDTVRRRRDGAAIRVSVSAFPTLDHERQLRGFGVTLVESSVHLAAMFQETEALFSVLHSNAIISVTDRAGMIVDVNDAFCRTSGYRRDELLGVDHRIVNSGAHDFGFWSDLWCTIGAGKPWHGEICNRARDGSLYWVHSVIDPTLDDSGRVDKHMAIQFDITASRRAARELAIERTRLDNIFHAANLGAWEWNVQTGEMRLNAGWAALIGERPERVSRIDAAQWFGYFEPADLARFQLTLQHHFVGDTDRYAGELRLRHAEGHWVWVIARGKVFTWTEDGRPEWMAGVHLDMSERFMVEEALQGANERYVLAANSAGIGVWDHDLIRKRITWDDRMLRLHGMERSDDFDPTTQWQSCVHPDDLPMLQSELDRAFASFGDFSWEFRNRWPNGEIHHLKSTARVIRNESGTPIRMTGVNIDITERKRDEEALRSNERFMRIVTENLPGMVAYWGADLRCTFANAAYKASLGDEGTDPIGRTMSDLLGASLFHDIEAHVMAALHGSEQRFEQTSLAADGCLHVYWRHYLPDRDADKIKGVISVSIDVSELKRAQEQLEELNLALQVRTRQAEEASVAKTAFLANTSHEIRTPLNAVIGLTYLLEHTNLDHEQIGYVERVKLASRSLLGVINNVLDLSKIEAGEMTLEETTFDVRTVISETLSIMTVAARAKRILLFSELDPEIPEAVRGDLTHLSQIFANLLSNAIKFTNQGSVHLKIGVIERSESEVVLKVVVRDTGIGIPVDLQPRLFAPFTQADASTTRRYGGTGLGLSIVKRLATLLGGDVGLSSTVGVGSEFSVTFPLRVEPSPRAVGSRPLELVVVSDSAHERAEFIRIARSLGWNVASVDADSRAFAQTCERLALDMVVDVFVFAARPPSREQLSILTGLPAGDTQAPLLLVMSDEPMETDFGLQIISLKEPVSAATLFKTVHDHVALFERDRIQRVRAAEITDDPVAGLQGTSLLVVDDSLINLELCQCILERAGALVTTAVNGREAIALLDGPSPVYDAVLIDVQMPELDGLEATRFIRRQLGLTSLPIFALTAGALSSERQRAIEAGVDEFVTKPFEPRALIRTLCHRLGRKPPLSSALSAPAITARSSWPALAGLDPTESNHRCGGDPVLLSVVLRQLFDEFGDLETLSGAAADVPDLAARLHKLSGSAGMIGAVALSEHAKRASRSLRQNRDDGLWALAQEVVPELRRLRASTAPLLVATAESSSPPARGAFAGSDDVEYKDRFEQLRELLKERRLDALDVFASVTPGLRDRLGNDDFCALQVAVDALQYEHALRILGAAGLASTEGGGAQRAPT